MHCQIKTNRTMTWSDKLQEFQAELYAKIIDFLNENGDNDYIRFDKEKMKSISWLAMIGFRSMLWTSLML